MPGIQIDGKWVTPWAMLDIDAANEGAVEAFREVLDRNRRELHPDHRHHGPGHARLVPARWAGQPPGRGQDAESSWNRLPVGWA